MNFVSCGFTCVFAKKNHLNRYFETLYGLFSSWWPNRVIICYLEPKKTKISVCFVATFLQVLHSGAFSNIFGTTSPKVFLELNIHWTIVALCFYMCFCKKNNLNRYFETLYGLFSSWWSNRVIIWYFEPKNQRFQYF